MVQYQKTGFHPPSLPFPLYLLFHSTESRQTRYPRKALIKENLATQVTRHRDEFPSRTLVITGMAPFGSNSRYCWLPKLGPLSSGHFPCSTNILPQFHNDLDSMGCVFGVEMWVLLVGFAGYGGFRVRMGL